MPTQPRALLKLGARYNGLTTPGLLPWHIKVTYQTYKLDGHRKATGTFQEWWAAPNEYKLSFSRKGYHLQAWVTPHGSYAIGNPNLPMPERLVYHWILAPIPHHPDLTGARLWYRVRLIVAPHGHGALHFPCVQIDSAKPSPGHLPPVYPIYCFSSSHPILRIAHTHVSENVIYTAVASLRGQYIPQRFFVTVDRMPVLSVKLLQGQSYGHLAPSIFTPPSNAKPAPPPSTGILYLTAAEAATHLIPPGFRHSHYWVILQNSHALIPLAISIGTHGHIEGMRLLSPTPGSQVYAARRLLAYYHFHPFLLHGHPTAVRTRLILDFRPQLPRCTSSSTGILLRPCASTVR